MVSKLLVKSSDNEYASGKRSRDYDDGDEDDNNKVNTSGIAMLHEDDHEDENGIGNGYEGNEEEEEEEEFY